MNVLDASKLARELMTEHGLGNWEFGFDNARRRFGVCYPTLKKITLSRPLVELNDVVHVRDVILHEIAHGLAPVGSHHNEKWRAIAKSIGCVGTRCYSVDVVQTPERYRATCGVCGTVYRRFRKPDKGSVFWCPKRACKKSVLKYRKVRLTS